MCVCADVDLWCGMMWLLCKVLVGTAHLLCACHPAGLWGWCGAAALQVCVQLPHGCKPMGLAPPQQLHTASHMFLAMLMLLHLLLLRRRLLPMWQYGLNCSTCAPPATNGPGSL